MFEVHLGRRKSPPKPDYLKFDCAKVGESSKHINIFDLEKHIGITRWIWEYLTWCVLHTFIYTPRKINGWNEKITRLKRKIIWTKPPFLGFKMLIFQNKQGLPWLFTQPSFGLPSHLLHSPWPQHLQETPLFPAGFDHRVGVKKTQGIWTQKPSRSSISMHYQGDGGK